MTESDASHYYSDELRSALGLAHDEAQRTSARYIGSEHVFLALLSLKSTTLQSLLVMDAGFDIDDARDALNRHHERENRVRDYWSAQNGEKTSTPASLRPSGGLPGVLLLCEELARQSGQSVDSAMFLSVMFKGDKDPENPVSLVGKLIGRGHTKRWEQTLEHARTMAGWQDLITLADEADNSRD